MVVFPFDVLKKKKLVGCEIPHCDARVTTAGIKHINEKKAVSTEFSSRRVMSFR